MANLPPMESQDDSATPVTPEALLAPSEVWPEVSPAGGRCSMPEPTGLAASKTSVPFLKVGFTRDEAAQALGISTQSLDRLVERGLLRPSRALRRPLFSRQELERFLAETA